MLENGTGMVMQIVRIKSSLSKEEMLAIAQERKPQFEAIPGLMQKYYVKLAGENEYGGVYIWDSRESLMKFRDSELAKTIGAAYQAMEPPSIEVVDIMFELR